jgi:hypothetical protein
MIFTAPVNHFRVSSMVQPSPAIPPAPAAFLFYGHAPSPGFLRRVAAARRELAGRADVHVLAYVENAAALVPAFKGVAPVHAYDRARMETMGYPRKGAAPFRILPGNTDMPVLAFARDHPAYDVVWLFEYDVAFTGPLSELVDAFAASPADLISTNIGPARAGWPHLVSGEVPPSWPRRPDPPLRALLSAFRASRRLLEEVERFYRDGGWGHYEWTWTYVAQATGLGIEDFGGSGPFVAPGNRRRFYTSSPGAPDLFPGTFRYRPAVARPGWRRRTLWHPVKEGHREPLVPFLRYRVNVTRRWLRNLGIVR